MRTSRIDKAKSLRNHDRRMQQRAYRQIQIEDDRYNQTDLLPQDRYNEIPEDRHRRNYQDRSFVQLNKNPNRSFNYHYSEDELVNRENEPRRRGHHFHEY